MPKQLKVKPNDGYEQIFAPQHLAWPLRGMKEVVKHDAQVIQRCHADDCRGFSSGGTQATKKARLTHGERASKAAGPYYTKPRFISPTFAIVAGEEWWEPKDGSGKKHLIWNDIRAFRKGKWQIVGLQDSVCRLSRSC